MLDLSLQGKSALVTGASSGIGRATALLFGKEGALVGLMARNKSRLEEVAATIGDSSGSAIVCCGDVTSSADCQRSIERVTAEFGGIDILVNAAGILEKGTTESTSLEEWDRTMDVNLKAVFNMMRLASSHLIKSKGVIINVSSVNGIRSFPGVLAYNVSKAAVDQLTRCAALEFAEKGVRVNSVNPGMTLTELHRRGGMDELTYQEFVKHSYDTHPLAKGLNRLSQPEDVGHLILFLSSPNAEWISGVNYLVDGGRGQTCFR
jgi:NAD(P)-dependent dehydrogenase (short-subunit alcohol dehydrogenase family)